jgi:hypothetical protein
LCGMVQLITYTAVRDDAIRWPNKAWPGTFLSHGTGNLHFELTLSRDMNDLMSHSALKDSTHSCNVDQTLGIVLCCVLYLNLIHSTSRYISQYPQASSGSCPLPHWDLDNPV